MISSRLAMQRLALRVIRDGDEDARLVLCDALQELGQTDQPTGRVRRISFRIRSDVHPQDPQRNVARLSASEERTIEITRSAAYRGSAITVPGKEILYNICQPRSSSIWTQFTTSKQDVYRRLIAANLLPRSIRFRDILWDFYHPDFRDSSLPWRLYLVRGVRQPLSERSRPRARYLFSAYRIDTRDTMERGRGQPGGPLRDNDRARRGRR